MKTQPLESLCEINPESLGISTPTDFKFQYLDISAVTKGRIDWLATREWRLAEAPSRGRRLLRPGDVLLCTVRPSLEAHARIKENRSLPLVGSSGFAVLRPKIPTDSAFIFHQLFTDSVSQQLRGLETGSNYPAVNESDVRQVLMFAPEASERARIAAVLDEMDEAIAKTEAVIAKLKQVRAGLLHDLLTRGLDEHGQLRDPVAHPEQFQNSPLGRIPRDWKVRTVGQLEMTIIDGDRGSNYPNGSQLFDQGFCVFLNNKNIVDGRIDFSAAQFISEERDSLLGKGKLNLRDIVITTRGTVGNIALFSNLHPYPNVRVNSGMILFRGYEDIFVPRFLVELWRFLFPSEYRRLSSGSAQPQFPIRDVLEFRLLVLEKSEQERIVSASTSIEHQIASEAVSLAKLHQLKSGLMNDLLTGRVRVPEGTAVTG